MDSKDDFKKIPWDAYSEQPFPIRHRRGLIARARHGYADYLKSALTAAALMPFIAGFQLALSAGYRPKRWKRPSRDIKDFAGLAVGLHSCDGPRLTQEIKKLRVKHLLLRVPVWEMDELHKYVDFVASLPECTFVICVMQTREEVIDLDLWRDKLRALVEAFWPRVKSFQIGQGVNRSKWGFFTTEEFLAFASVAEELRQDFRGIRLVGPSILDFETIPLVRSLAHGYPIRWDAVGCALYVDRRGSPRNRQMLLFNTTQKILHFAACIRFSNKAERRFWITEVNWPLKDQGHYSPTGEAECVSEEEAGRYLTEYYEDAWNSQLVDRVYWWQLVAKGFGLMEPMDDGTLRPRPAYHTFKAILENGLSADSGGPERNASPSRELADEQPKVAARVRRA